MANLPPQADPTLNHLPRAVVAEYYKLVARQKQEEADFERRVNTAEAQLSQKHASEMQTFRMKHNLSEDGNYRPQITDATPSQSTTAKTPQRACGNFVNEPARTHKEPAVKDNSMPALANPAAVRMRKSKRAFESPVSQKVDVIDLISDNDEPQPAKRLTPIEKPAATPPIPSASISFFGNSAKKIMVRNRSNRWERFMLADYSNHTQEKSQVKHGNIGNHDLSPNPSVHHPKAGPQATGVQSSSRPLFTSSPKQGNPYQNGYQSQVASNFEHAAPETSFAVSPSRRKKPIPSDPHPELSPNVLRDQRIDCSSILAHPPALPRDPTLLSLQQHKKDGGFVGNILHNERSKSWTPGLGKLFERPGDDVDMQDAPQASGSTRNTDDAKATGVEGLLSTAKAQVSADARPLTSDQPFSQGEQTRDVESVAVTGPQLLSDPFLARSVLLKKGNNSNPTVGFKVPAIPARDATVNPGFYDASPFWKYNRKQEGTVSSRTSSHTFANSSKHTFDTLRTRREASVTTQTSAVPPSVPDISPSRKRKKQVSVSSDEGPDFEPSSASSIDRARKNSALPAVKRTKACKDPSPLKKLSDKAKKFGFRPLAGRKGAGLTTTPSSKAGGRSAPSTPRAPKGSKTSIHTPLTPASPSLNAAPRQVPLPVPLSAPSHSSLHLLGTRRAKRNAQNKIDEYIKETEEFETEEEIRAADEMDEKMNNAPVNALTPGQLSQGIRGMSLTPAPTTTSDASDDGVGQKDCEAGVYGSEQWCRDRLKGDRYLAKSKFSIGRDVESECELDCSSSKARVVNERIEMEPIEELDLTQEEQRQDRMIYA
jgi:hypothetical protein